MRSISQQTGWQINRIREQARSHSVSNTADLIDINTLALH
jgi:hypothetical protein